MDGPAESCPPILTRKGCVLGGGRGTSPDLGLGRPLGLEGASAMTWFPASRVKMYGCFEGFPHTEFCLCGLGAAEFSGTLGRHVCLGWRGGVLRRPQEGCVWGTWLCHPDPGPSALVPGSLTCPGVLPWVSHMHTHAAPAPPGRQLPGRTLVRLKQLLVTVKPHRWVKKFQSERRAHGR